MNKEGQPDQNESPENIEQLFEGEIRKALSPVWAKTAQELLPGYLPNKPKGEFTKDELGLYRSAYKILGEMVKNGEVEALVEEEFHQPPSVPAQEFTATTQRRFKLKTQGGKKSPDQQVAWQGGLVTNL